MGKLVSLKVDGKVFELRPAQKVNIFEILESATVVPDGMKPRTMTGTEYESIIRPQAMAEKAKPEMTTPTQRPKTVEKHKQKKGWMNKNK